MSSSGPLKLKYDFTPRPSPIQASVSTDNPNTIDLTVMISDPKTFPVTITQLTIEIPVGHESARDLSAAPDLPQPAYDTSGQWQINSSGSIVNIAPAPDASGEIGKDPILFALEGIQVNGTSGTVPITITEFYPSAPKVADDATYSLVKEPADPVINFRAAPESLEDPNQPVTLYWECSDEGKKNYVYSLRSPDLDWQPKDCDKAGQCFTWQDGRDGVQTPNLEGPAQFFLDILQPVAEGHYKLYDTLDTTVKVSRPGILKFQATASNPIYDNSFTLEWSLANADGFELDATYADGEIETITDDWTRRNIMVTPKKPNTKYTLTAKNNSTSAEASAEVTGELAPPMPLGSVIAYSGTQDPPSGQNNDAAVQWMLCDGRALAASVYSELYELIGTSFGDGSENNQKVSGNAFNLPDLRGRFIRGADNMGGQPANRDPDVATRTAMMKGGKNTGTTNNKVGSVQPDSVGPHEHSLQGIWGQFYAKAGDPPLGFTDGQQWQSNPTNILNPEQHKETRPVNAYLNFIIRVK